MDQTDETSPPTLEEILEALPQLTWLQWRALKAAVAEEGAGRYRRYRGTILNRGVKPLRNVRSEQLPSAVSPYQLPIKLERGQGYTISVDHATGKDRAVVVRAQVLEDGSLEFEVPREMGPPEPPKRG